MSSPEVRDGEPDYRIRPNLDYYDLFDNDEEEEEEEKEDREEELKRATRRKLFYEKQVEGDDYFPPTQVVPSPVKIQLYDF